MMEAIVKKINDLHKEADQLVNRKIEIEREIGQIEQRLTQIVGAVTELDKLRKELEGAEKPTEE